MAFVSQTLEWLRALLVGLGHRATAKDSHAGGTHATPDRPTPSPAHEQALLVSPVMLGAWLVLARLRRARRAAQNDPNEAHIRPHPLAPVHIPPPWQRQHAPKSTELTRAIR